MMPVAAANSGSSRAGQPARPRLHDPPPPKYTVGSVIAAARTAPALAKTRTPSPPFGYGISVTISAEEASAPRRTTDGASTTRLQRTAPTVGPKRRARLHTK